MVDEDAGVVVGEEIRTVVSSLVPGETVMVT